MTNDWMIDVLTDLRKFATKQAMPELAEHLDDAILVAATELRAIEAGQNLLEADEYQSRDLSGTLADNGVPG